MKELRIFENKEFGCIRTLELDKEIWFVGKDVAEVLGYSNASKAVINHVDEEDKQFIMLDIAHSQNGNMPTGQSKTTFINESGLYSLILSSKLPKAKEFKRWVTSEVLPTIRKYGMYSTEELLDNPDLAIQIFQTLKIEREKRKELEKENNKHKATIQKLQPMADYVEKILNCDGVMMVTQIAKDYGMTSYFFNRILHKLGVQYKTGTQWVLYEPYQDKGYTQSKTRVFKVDGEEQARVYTVWTQKGRLFLYEFLKEYGIVPIAEKESKQS
jgi:prophage antirepressor-like protein